MVVGIVLMQKGEQMADLIDRQAAIKAIEDLQDCYNGFSDTYDKACIIGVLEELPSAPERRGKWIDDELICKARCSVCGEEFSWFDNDLERFLFCPNCGAKMEEEDG